MKQFLFFFFVFALFKTLFEKCVYAILYSNVSYKNTNGYNHTRKLTVKLVVCMCMVLRVCNSKCSFTLLLLLHTHTYRQIHHLHTHTHKTTHTSSLQCVAAKLEATMVSRASWICTFGPNTKAEFGNVASVAVVRSLSTGAWYA